VESLQFVEVNYYYNC